MTFTKMAFKQHEVEVAESWEELEETDVLEKKFRSIIPSSKSLEAKKNSINSGLRKIDSLETQNVHPKKIQILKRPPHEVQEQKKANAKKMFPPRKTYEQREREYAEARLRIFGEPEKVEVENFTFLLSKDPVTHLDKLIRLPTRVNKTKEINKRRH